MPSYIEKHTQLTFSNWLDILAAYIVDVVVGIGVNGRRDRLGHGLEAEVVQVLQILHLIEPTQLTKNDEKVRDPFLSI